MPRNKRVTRAKKKCKKGNQAQSMPSIVSALFVFFPKLHPHFTAGHVLVLKFQVHDFAPIIIFTELCCFFPIISRLQVPVTTWLVLIEVVCFSKSLIQRVQKL